MREVRARFKSESCARKALEMLAQAPVLASRGLQPQLLVSPAGLSALVAPPEMSHPNRIQKDEALSARVAQRLDALLGISPEDTKALLGQPGVSKLKLDLQVLYLRRVHHFCFYAAAWCKDEWELRDRCGHALLRDGLSGAGQEAAEGAWAKAHDERLERFLSESAAPKRPTVKEAGGQAAADALALCQQKTECVTEGKFRCMHCGKYFKGSEYVHKHLHKAHADLFVDLQRAALDKLASAAFLEDPSRPTCTQPLASRTVQCTN